MKGIPLRCDGDIAIGIRGWTGAYRGSGAIATGCGCDEGRPWEFVRWWPRPICAVSAERDEPACAPAGGDTAGGVSLGMGGDDAVRCAIDGWCKPIGRIGNRGAK